MMRIDIWEEIVAWLLGLDPADQVRVTRAIDRLAILGHRARMPFSRCLGEGLFELRFTPDRRIVLLTTFRKQRNNERAEIERARQVAAIDEKEAQDG